MENTVELTAAYGGDELHAMSAWMSTSTDLQANLHRVPGLLKTLAENGHHTPFEKSYIQFLITCDTASHIHFLKHRIGVSINGESARYKELKEDKTYIPSDWPEKWQDILRRSNDGAYVRYHEAAAELTPLLGRKRAKESARYFFPYCNQTTIDVAFNFRSFMHFQKLRNDEHAQQEIHDIAAEMIRQVKEAGGFEHSLAAFGY